MTLQRKTIPVWYTVDDIAGAAHVSRGTVREWAKEGRIRGRKVGRRILFSEAAVARLFAEPEAATSTGAAS